MERILIKSSPVSSPCPPRLLCSSSSVTHNCSSNSLKIPRLRSSLNSDYHGFRIFLQKSKREPKRGSSGALTVQMSLCIGKAQRWWEKGVKPNMTEITSAQDLVDSLSNSGDKLVVVDFFSPGCGGCKALHPKICQFSEMNPDVQFLQVNYEEHKSMCYSLNVHVLPFFRFYRGTHGRLCSFSCTNATIKKFKDALAKHSPERCSLGPPKGLEESELLALAANKDLSFTYIPKPTVQPVLPKEAEVAEPVPSKLNLPIPSSTKPIKNYEENNTLVSTS